MAKNRVVAAAGLTGLMALMIAASAAGQGDSLATNTPPALAFATKLAGNDIPSVTYATVYPLTMILRIVAAQLLILLLA